MKYLKVILPWIAALFAFLAYGCEREANGTMRGIVSELTRQRDAFERASKVERTVFVHDTIRVTKTTTRYETLRDSVFATDTLLAHDTTFIRVVASADTAIHACRDVVSSCARNLQIADSLRAIDRRLIKTLEKAQPSFVRRWGERVVVGSLGYTIRAITAR